MIKALLQATRPRTFPLAAASIICGNGLAAVTLKGYEAHNWVVFFMTLWVALALQILSNLANDYGDGTKGTDDYRDASSPQRMTASGLLSPTQFRALIYIWALLTFCSGVALISIGFDSWRDFLLFLAFGVIAIIAAMAYTMGKHPYGYRAMGEVAVLIFFGWFGVLGSVYLQTHQFDSSHLLPATGCGLLAACVLYINNMRDVYGDRQAGKLTLAVLIGETRMQWGYLMLLASALGCYLLYGYLYGGLASMLWLVVIPALIRHINSVLSAINLSPPSVNKPSDKDSHLAQVNTVQIGEQLKAIVLITLVINLIFVIGLLQQTFLGATLHI